METIELVRDLIGRGLEPGEPRTKGGSAIVPLFGGAAAGDYILAEQAFAEGSLTITEKGEGTVPELLSINQGDLPVLILDGEQLEGAKQDRVLNASVLLPGRSKTTIPVACVEAGRWRFDRGSDFSASSDHAYTGLRSKNARSKARAMRAGSGHRVDQSEVWGEVHDRLMRVGATSETGAMKAAYDHRRSELDAMLAQFRRAESGQTGAVACIGGRPIALDAFDKPEVFARLWPRLATGYAIEALDAPAATVEPEAVRGFLAAAAGGHLTSHDGVALGTDVVITSHELVGNAQEVVGNALVWNGGAVHVALFASRRTENDVGRSPGGPIAGPTVRGTRRRHR